MENTKENVLKFLMDKKAIPHGCENNEYWTYWRNMLLEYGWKVLPQADVISSVCHHPITKRIYPSSGREKCQCGHQF